VNRSILAILSIGIGVVGGAIFTYSLMRPGRETPAAPPTAPATANAPAPRRPSIREAPPAAAAPPRAVRRAPATANAEPEPAPAEAPLSVGILRIDSDVPGAQVFIDREFLGAAPVTAASVKPGTHRINVSAEGYDGVAETVEVSPGPRDVMIKLREVRLDAKVDVVHKHRMGSCKGRLIATPQGMRYETADKDDSFAAPLLDLEAFDVDYLEKNLRVKPRKGKLFNFTDPEGNADRLFVFHRDVEKARERLKKGDPAASQ
jgi:PEGA domain-containing protein